MESTLKAFRDGESVLDLSPRSTINGSVEDLYGEDQASEDQLVTPWTFSVARDPQYNKGLAFTEKERDAHYLRGLLPPTISSQQLQEKKLMNDIRQYEVPLQKYVAMMDLQAMYQLSVVLVSNFRGINILGLRHEKHDHAVKVKNTLNLSL